jgi:hypothetical protein
MQFAEDPSAMPGAPAAACYFTKYTPIPEKDFFAIELLMLFFHYQSRIFCKLLLFPVIFIFT